MSQRSNNHDVTLAAPFARGDFNVVNEGPDNIDRLWPSGLVMQDVVQLTNLPTIKFGKIRVECDSASGLRSV